MGLFGWLTGTDKYGAAQSALIAKYTFSQLTEFNKNLVRTTAREVLRAGGYSPDMIDEKIAKMRETERYCLYSMAMAAGGIKPALKGVLYNDQWYHIPNPFAALINAEKQIKIAQYEIKNKYNINIDLTDNNKGTANDNHGQQQRNSVDNAEAICLQPDDAEAYYNRGVAFDKLGQYQRAIEEYNQVIRLRPDAAVAYYIRGQAYDNLVQYQRAIEDYNEAIRLQPNYAEAYNNRGRAYDDLGQYQRAIEDYNHAIHLKPDVAGTYINRGGAYFKQNNDNLGYRDAQKACELGDCRLLEWAKSKGRSR